MRPNSVTKFFPATEQSLPATGIFPVRAKCLGRLSLPQTVDTQQKQQFLLNFLSLKISDYETRLGFTSLRKQNLYVFFLEKAENRC